MEAWAPSGELTDDSRNNEVATKRLHISDTCKWLREGLIADGVAYPLMVVMFVMREHGT